MSTRIVNFLTQMLYNGNMTVKKNRMNMATQGFLIILYSFMTVHAGEVGKPDLFAKNHEACVKIGRDPYFDIDMVIGKPWRIYYTWNLKLDSMCLDIVLQNATKKTIQRIWSDMIEYLEQQPVWEAATLLMTMGSARHEILLFADQGPAGNFLGVPNVIRDSNISPSRKSVPLLKFQMKLINSGKFLLLMDCHMGGGSLSARSEQTPYRLEITAEAAKLDLGDGHPACTKEKNKEEQFFAK